MKAVARKLMTAGELERMSGDDYRYELVGGELLRMSPVGGEHGLITVELVARLQAHVKQQGLGVVLVEVGYRLASDPDTVRAPDISFLATSRISPAGLPKGFIVGAPDLAVEVVSPEDTAGEIDAKVQEYLVAGARMVLVVQPRTRTVTMYRPDGAARVFRSSEVIGGEDVLPGFTLRVDEIFMR